MTENISMSAVSCALRSGWLDIAPRRAEGPNVPVAGESSVLSPIAAASGLVPMAKAPAIPVRRERSADALIHVGTHDAFAYTSFDPGSHPRRFPA